MASPYQDSLKRATKTTPAQTVAVPAPTGGWNARDSLDAMDPTDALALVNFFPTYGQVQRRGGYSAYCTGLGAAVETLTEYNAASTRQLLAAAGDSIYDVSAGGAVGAALATGFTSARWQTAMFQNAGGVDNMIWVNGADPPQIYDGSTITAATISGPTSVNNLLGCTVFKTRVFYWENASQNLWYSASGAIAGVLTAFPLGQLSGFGGNIQSIGTWTRDGGSGPDDYCVIFMDSGDVLMYQGTNIADAAAWALVGIFHIGSPIGSRCWMKIGPDIAVINKDGFVPLSQVMPGLWNPQEALSNKITFAAQSAANQYHDNFGWQPLLYPLGNMAIFNVPVSSSTFNQYVLNTATGSWTQFQGLNGICWSLFVDDPYFGGADGTVYLFNGSTASGAFTQIGTDAGGPITCSALTAWNYFGDRTKLKRMNLLRFMISSDNPGLSFGIALGVDFNYPTAPATVPSIGVVGTPWGSPWGSSWAPGTTNFIRRVAATGVGNAFSLSLLAVLSDTQFNWNSVTYQYEPGIGV